MAPFISQSQPERWKIFKALPVAGQNIAGIPGLEITDAESSHFLEINTLHAGIEKVTENNDTIAGSYLMIDLAGRYFDNVNGSYTYSEPILQVGMITAINEINQDYDKFIIR